VLADVFVRGGACLRVLLTLVLICVRDRTNSVDDIHALCPSLPSIPLVRSCLPLDNSAYYHTNNNLTYHSPPPLPHLICPCTVPISIPRRYTYSTSTCILPVPSILVWPAAASPWLTLEPRCHSTTFCSRQTLSPDCHSYLTITSQTRQSPLKHRFALLTAVNRSPVDLYLISLPPKSHRILNLHRRFPNKHDIFHKPHRHLDPTRQLDCD
jgi:hypothetical protein